MKYIKSIGEKQDEIIADILKLYNNNDTIDLDCTYSKGVFYKSGVVQYPKLKTDLEPQSEDVMKADSTNLPFEDSSFKCIMFDPPFIITGKTYKTNKDGSSIIAKRFSGYENFEQLKSHWFGTLKECNRLLKKDGIVIIKCQNTVSSGKNHFSCAALINKALDIGLTPLDEFVLESKSKITSFGGRWKNQKHALKYHSYFLVFKKSKNRVNYE